MNNIEAANKSFVNALVAPVSSAEVDTKISQAVMRELVAGGAATSMKLTLAVQQNVELLGMLTRKLLMVTSTRLDEMFDEAEGRDLVERFNIISTVSARLGKTILDFREMKLLVDTLRKLAESPQEEPVAVEQLNPETQAMVKEIHDNPAELFRVLNVVRYMRGGGDPIEGLNEARDDSE